MTSRLQKGKTQMFIRLRRSIIISVLLFTFLNGLIFQPAAFAQQATQPQRINLERVVAQLEPEIQRTLIEGKIPSCTVALISGDEIIWTGTYGYSNLWARTPAVPNTIYLIGSTFKAMSTVALLQLMEQGKFKLDDRVNDYLTDFKIKF